MRSLVIAALFGTAGCICAQTTAVHVTYTTRAARAEVVVKDLAKLAKVDLQTSPATQNEILVISVSDMPLSEVMSRIATVTSGEWKQEGAIYRLSAATALRGIEERDAAAKRIVLVRKAIDTRIKNEQKAKERMAKMVAQATAGDKSKTDTKPKKKTGDEEDTSDEEASSDFGFMGGGPEEHAITELLKELDPAALAEASTGERIVFSTDPTRTQRTLGQNAVETINAFIQKHDATVTAMSADTTDQIGQGLTDQQSEMIKNMMKRQTSKIGVAAKAILIASTSPMAILGMSSGLQLELRIYDKKGTVTFSGNSNFDLDENDFMSKIRRQTEEAMDAAADGKAAVTDTKPPVETKSTPIELSEDSKALEAAGNGMNNGASFTIKVGADLKKKLFLPSIYDPLSFVETDAAFAYAKSKGKPLVADIPDKALSSSGPMAMSLAGDQHTRTLEEYSKDLDNHTSMVVVPDQDFVVLKPADPSQSRSERLDRVALTTLMQATEEKGVPSLDDMCAYAQLAPNPMQGGIGQVYVMMFIPGAFSFGLDGMVSWDMMRLYGQFTPDVRSTLMNGGRISLGTLSPSQHALVERMTYGPETQLSVNDPNKKSDDQPFWMRLTGMFGSSGGDYKTEPTEVAPNGLPSDGFFDMKGTSEPFAMPVAEVGTVTAGILGVLGPAELGLFKMMKTMTGAEAVSNSMPKFNKLRLGERALLNFTFHIAPGVSVKQTLKDHHLVNNGSIFSEDNLPADLQKLVAEKAEEFKKSPMGAMGGFMGNQGIHP